MRQTTPVPMSRGSGTSSSAGPSLKKCRGESTCVPMCTIIDSSVMLSGSSGMLAMRSMRGGGNELMRGTVGDKGQVRSIQSPAALAGRDVSLVFQPRQPVPGAVLAESHIALVLRAR